MAQLFNPFVDPLILSLRRSLVLLELQREAALMPPTDGLNVFQTGLRSAVEGCVSTAPGSCMPGLL